jgi:plastocyanin
MRSGPKTFRSLIGSGPQRTHRRACLVVAVLACLGGAAFGAIDPQFRVSQKGREFNPTDLKIKRGDVVEIVNDDADLLHHAYVESDQFNFDSGDQQPGSKVDIKFTVAGDFMVLCGIHPKMKMSVHVQ